MAGGRIKGITIEIGGDATGLDRALNSVDKTLNQTQRSLKDVNKLLKIDPSNAELLAQRQKLLTEAISETEDRLRKLKDANNQVKDSVKNYNEWEKAYTPIKKEIDDTNSKIAELRKALADKTEVGDVDTEEYMELQNQLKESLDKLKELKKQAQKTKEEFGNPISTTQYDGLQREIIETENKLKSLKEAAKETGKSMSETFENVGNKAKKAGDSLQPVSAAATGLAAAAIATVPATEELRTDLSKLDQNARESKAGIDVAREAFEKFNVVSDEVDSSVEATSNLLQAGFTESNLQKAVENLSGAYLRFPDTLKIESLADSLQETIATGKATGQFAELLDRLGIGADNFSEKMGQLTSQTARQNFALQTLAEAGLADTYNEYLKNNEALVESKQASYEFQEAMAGLAEILTPIVTRVTEVATSIINWFNQLSPAGQNLIMIIVTILAVLAPLLTTFGNVALGISNITNAVNGMTWIPEVITKIGGVFKSLFGIIMAHPVVTVITVIIGAIVLLYNKCEWFRNGVNTIVGNVISFFQNLGNNIVTMKDKAVSAFQNMIEGIRNKVSQITSIVQNGFQGAISFLQSLPAKALTWGRDFIQGLIDGIKAKINAVVSTVAGLASKIASYLHFSRPDIGPLHYYEEWMPDFMDGLSEGIYKNLPKVARAAEAVANTLNLGNLKDSNSNVIDANAIYGAVRKGASEASGGITIIDEKSFKRGLVRMGVVFQ